MVTAWAPTDDDEGEVLVPLSLRATLWVARALGATPARLRRTRRGWWISVSPPLAYIQRLIAVVSCIFFVILGTHLLTIELRTKVAEMSFAKILNIVESSLVMLLYLIGVFTAQDRLNLLICLLRQMQKINRSFCFNTLKYKSKGINPVIIAYMMWHLITYGVGFLWHMADNIMNHNLNVIIFVLQSVLFYQLLVGSMIRLTISVNIFEITSTLTLLNDQLEYLLTTPNAFTKEVKLKLYLKELQPQKTKNSGRSVKGASSLEDDIGGVRHINQCHGAICDIVAKVDYESGPYLLLSFMLLFLKLMTVPQSLLTSLGSSTTRHLVYQTNRLLLDFSDLLITVEPCQRFRDQLDRTRLLLGMLMGQPDHQSINLDQLELFVLQAQMRDAALAPMGVITIGRPLVASMIGGVVTFLVIVFQIQNV